MQSRERALATNPEVMAVELIETQETVRYMAWGLGVLAFFVWILLQSRR